MNKQRKRDLIQYIERKQKLEESLRPRTCVRYLRDTFPGLTIHYNRFSKKFLLVSENKIIQLPVQIPIQLDDFISVLLKTTYLHMSTSTITTLPVSIADIATKYLGSTMRVDGLNCLEIKTTVDTLKKNTDADNVCAIYEETADEINELINNLGDEDEKKEFNSLYESIVSPHIKREYVNIDRNAINDEEMLAGNFRKMQAGLLAAKTALPEQIWVPTFALSLHKHVPRDKDGYPMVVAPPKNIDNLDTLLTSAVKNTSSGTAFKRTNAQSTKQQLIGQSAIIAQNILRQLSDDNDLTPIISSTINPKTENTKRIKSLRYFFMESIVFNILNQIVFGHILDNQHQIALTTFFNGLSPEYGIGRYTVQRMFKGLHLDLKEFEKIIAACLAEGASSEKVSEGLTSLLMTITYDYTNFEFYHHVMICMIDFFATAYHYTCSSEDDLFLKLMAYIFENIAITEIHVGKGEVVRTGAAAMASGAFRTLVGNSGRNEGYTDTGVLLNIYQKQVPKPKKELRLFLNAMKNINKQGDDGFGVFLSRHIDHVIHFFANIHNYCCVKIKPEIRRLISNHTEKFCNIMTNMGGDFLKYCVVFNTTTGEICFSRPFQSFLLRLLSPNNASLEPAKILQTARSFALNAALCPMGILYAKKLFDKAFKYLSERKLLTPGTSDKELFADSVALNYDLAADISLDEAELAKQSFKKIDNPNEQTTSNNVVSFPMEDEINGRVATDLHLISKLVNSDNYYAVHRLNYQIALRYLEQESNSMKSITI